MRDLLERLRDEMLENYIRAYEGGRIQGRPRLRFVDREGRACPAAAFAGAGDRADFAGSEPFTRFLGSDLEAISRCFESGQLEPSELYRDCVLERARRSGRAGEATATQATARKSASSSSPAEASHSRISPRAPGVPTAAST